MTNALHSRIKFVEESLTRRLKSVLDKESKERSPKRRSKKEMAEVA